VSKSKGFKKSGFYKKAGSNIKYPSRGCIMKTSFKKNSVAACILAATSMGSTFVLAEEGVSSTIDLNFRYRIETVSQEGNPNDAEASTLRTRATINTNWHNNIDSVVEFDDVSAFGLTDYNSGQGTSPNRSQYPVVADPTGTEVNQAFVRYNGENAKVAYGRQRILIGNQRFVGGVGWRQNEQTFDSITVNSKLGAVDVNYAYIFNVNRIFGESVAAGDHEHNSHVFNMDYKVGDGQLSGYILSLDNEDAAALSSTTFGVSYSAKSGALVYTFEYASQSDAADNPNSYDADYYLIEGKYSFDEFTLGGGIEVLGGDTAGGQGFTTSLATLHKFQGWADVFLNTPAAGIEDTYVNASMSAGGFNFTLVYHDFSTDEGSIALGTEVDFSVAKKINNNLSALLKYADFSSDNVAYGSVDKLWLMLSYKL
jgi:hypothetical protein